MKKVYTLEIVGGRLHVRQVPPMKGAFRIQEIGEKGHSQRVAMKNPRTGKWITQSWTFPVQDVLSRRPATVKILKRLGRWEEAYKFVEAARKKLIKTAQGPRAPPSKPVEENPKTHQPTMQGHPQPEKVQEYTPMTEKVMMTRALHEKLEEMDRKIMDKHGWKNGNDVEKNNETYKQEVSSEMKQMKIPLRSLPMGVYENLENDNYHDLNQSLEELGYYVGKRND